MSDFNFMQVFNDSLALKPADFFEKHKPVTKPKRNGTTKPKPENNNNPVPKRGE
jgi:hypothetical protein